MSLITLMKWSKPEIILMVYKGYIARIEYSKADSCFIGHISGIDDVVGFHSESVAELWVAFEEAVDDYLQTCEKLNRPPQKYAIC